MKVTCKRENLSDAFQLVSGVVEARATKQILQDVKIEASGNALELSATDLEIGIKCQVDAVEVKEEGAAVVPAASMNSILRESSDEAIELSLEKDNCEVRGQDSYFRLPTQNPDEFPVIPGFPEETTIEIGRDDLRTMIRRTVFAVAVEQTRYALNGLLFRLKRGKLTIVATDGRRLAQITRKAKVQSTEVKHAIVPTKAVSLLEKMLTEEEEEVRLAFRENKLWAQTGATVLCAALVEGQFPDYEAIIPSDCDVKIGIATSELLSAVRRAALLTDEESRVLRLGFAENLLTLRYEAPERGEAKVEMGLKYDGAPLEICFNPQFILDMLKAIEEEEVRMELKDGASAGVIRAGDDYLYLLMPISLSEE